MKTNKTVMCFRITVRQAGLFIFAEVADLGIVLQWDKGTRVVLKADPKWKGRVRHLQYTHQIYFGKIVLYCLKAY